MTLKLVKEFIGHLFKKHKPEITILHVQETELGESEEFARTCALSREEALRSLGYKPLMKLAKDVFVDGTLKDAAIETKSPSNK